MLRISEAETANGHVVLKLEGRVVGPWVQELDRASKRFLESGRSVKLDLSDVSYVDREGVALLRRLKGREVRIESCSPFVAEELREAEGA